MSSRTIAVYGTLKKGFHNHSVMVEAKGRYEGNDYLQVDKLKDVGYPCVKFSNDSNKRLMVELYEVNDNNIFILDSLEGYDEGRERNHYIRIKVITLNGKEVEVYEINSDITKKEDNLERHFHYSEGDKNFYSWK